MDTADAKLAISRIDKVILPMSLKASSESDIPVVEDSSLSRSSKLPLYVREKLNAAGERLLIMHENQMESLLMIQAEAKAQLQVGTSIVQLYTMSENILHKVRGNMSHSDITDSAFDVSYNSIYNEDASLPQVQLGDIISDAKSQQHVYIDKLKREVIQMNILIRLCDERRDAFLNFDAEEDNSTKLHIGDNLAKDILPDTIAVHTARRQIATKDSHSDTVAKNGTSNAALPSSPSSYTSSAVSHGRKVRRRNKEKSMILLSLKEEEK